MDNHNNLNNPHLDNYEVAEGEALPVFLIPLDAVQYLMKMREQLVYASAYTQYNWEAPNLAVVAAAQGFQRGQLQLLDDLIRNAKLAV